MIRSNRILLTAAAMLGFSLAVSSPGMRNLTMQSVAATLPSSIELKKLGDGSGYQSSGRWPYNGKNRQQRAELRAGFFAMMH